MSSPHPQLIRPDTPPPPQSLVNLEAEQNVLGTMLFDNDRLDDVGGALDPASFAEPFHQRLFAAVRDLIRAGRRADPTTVQDRFKADPAFAEFGGFTYLCDLLDRCSPPAAKDHAAVVADLSTRRAVVQAATAAAHNAGDPERDGQALIADLESALGEIASTGAQDEWLDAGSVVARAVQNARTRDGAIRYTWGIDDLDEKTGGLNSGESVIVAGRPGMMKTGVAIRIALANAFKGYGTTLVSLEMSADPLGLRMACATAHDRLAPTYSGKPGEDGNPWYIDAAKGRLHPKQWDKLAAAQAMIDGLPLLVETRPGLTVPRIEAAVRRAHRKWHKQGVEPGPVVVDHLGIVRAHNDRRGNKHAEVADVSRALAEMAKRLGVPVVALCQLNRGVEGREDKRPALSDLRQAGELEEDARAVVMIYRPAYYLREPLGHESADAAAQRETELRRVKNQLLLLLEKNSHGPTGQIEAWCDPATSAVGDLHIGGRI